MRAPAPRHPVVLDLQRIQSTLAKKVPQTLLSGHLGHLLDASVRIGSNCRCYPPIRRVWILQRRTKGQELGPRPCALHSQASCGMMALAHG
jgi:hypothetical protein